MEYGYHQPDVSRACGPGLYAKETPHPVRPFIMVEYEHLLGNSMAALRTTGIRSVPIRRIFRVGSSGICRQGIGKTQCCRRAHLYLWGDYGPPGIPSDKISYAMGSSMRTEGRLLRLLK